MAQTQQAVGDLVCHLSRFSADDDLFRQASEVLDEQDPQADCNCPELADRQRFDLLVGEHHSPKALWVEATVGMSEVGPSETEYTRIAGEVAVGQLGKLVVVVGGQVVADLAELLVDDREVVDEPFGGRRDRTFVLDGPRQKTV